MFESIRSWAKAIKEEPVFFDIPIKIDTTSEALDIKFEQAVPKGARPTMIKGPPYQKRVKSTAPTFFASLYRTEWLEPQYDHMEIEVVHDLEGYFARATRAKKALFSKEGFAFVGPKDERVSYIKNRFKQIERATRIPTAKLLEDIVRDLIVHSNAYILKVRNPDASGGKVRNVNGRKIKPIAGYFRLDPVSMVPKIDANGNVIAWKVSVGTKEKVFSADDVIHIAVNQKAAYPLGVPSVVSVLQDIHALRHIEENIEVLIRKSLFPLLVFKVGQPGNAAGVYPDGESELKAVQSLVYEIPMEGSIVVSEKIEVDAIGSEGRALRVEGYVKHFKERVFAGLDVSSVDMGEGGTASRSTAQTMSRNLVDSVKSYQRTIEDAVNLEMVEELLFESTFSDITVLNPENLVRLRFKEIDTEAKQAKENHAMQLFTSNGITYSELREELKREPLTPEQEKELYWEKFGKPMALIAAVDEPYSSSATSNSVQSKSQPSNQHGTRKSPKLNKDFVDAVFRPSQNPILYWHRTFRKELQERWVSGQFDQGLAKLDAMTNYDEALRDFLILLRKVVRTHNSEVYETSRIYQVVEDRATMYVYKLRDDLIRKLADLDPELGPVVAFDSLQYRADSIFATETAFAKNLAKLHLARLAARTLQVVADSNACNACLAKLTEINPNDSLAEDKIPPHHPHCICGVEIV